MVVTNAGLAEMANLGIGSGTAFSALAYGVDGTAFTAASTALNSETDRAAATTSRTTTDTTNDTMSFVHEFTAAGSVAVQECGIFNNNVSGGTMLAAQTFTTINLVASDTIEFTYLIDLD